MISPTQLVEYGLQPNQAKIYLASLELGPTSIQKIAEKAGIERVSAYGVVTKLEQAGLIIKGMHGKRPEYSVADPNKLLGSLEQKAAGLRQIIPELEALKSKAGRSPKFRYYEGRAAVWTAYLDRIRHAVELKENLVYGSSESLLKAYPEEYIRFTEERVRKGIAAKIIVERSAAGTQEARTAASQTREVRFLPAGTSLNATTIIYGHRVMIVSWQGPTLVILEDQDYAASQRTIFKLLWDSLPDAG